MNRTSARLSIPTAIATLLLGLANVGTAHAAAAMCAPQTLAEQGGAPITFTLSCTSSDGGTLTYGQANHAQSDTLTGTGPAFTYTSRAGTPTSVVVLSFPVYEGDPNFPVGYASVQVNVTATPKPVCTSSTQFLKAYNLTPVTGTVSCTDPTGTPLTYSIDTSRHHGKVTISADGAFSYTNNDATYVDSDVILVTANDGFDSDPLAIPVQEYFGTPPAPFKSGGTVTVTAASAIAGGVASVIQCKLSCMLKTQMTVSGAVAKSLGLSKSGTKPVVIGTGITARAPAGAVTNTVTLTKAARVAIKKVHRKVSTQETVTQTLQGGTKSTLHQSVIIK